MADDPTAGFAAIAPYLQHPLVLVGFALLIVVGLFRAFLRSDKVATASSGASGRLLLALARYGFVLALAVILLGFALVFYRDYRGEQARLEKERAVAEAIAGVEARYRSRLAELEGQGQLHQATIGSLNEAVRALAAKTGSPQAAPGVDVALAELARGETAAAERIFADVLARRSAEGAAATREAAEAARHLGALAYLHDTGKALAAYRRAAELDPADAWTWIFIAQLEARAGRLAAAERAATQARAAAQDAGNERDAMAALNELGDIRAAQGNLTEAKRAYLSAKDVAAKLAAADPGNAGWQRDLSVSWNKLGDVRVAQGDLAGALQAYTEGKTIAEQLAAADPGNAEWQRDLIVSHWRIADIFERLPQRAAEAGMHWSEALRISRELADAGRLAPTDAYFIEELERRVAAIGQP